MAVSGRHYFQTPSVRTIARRIDKWFITDFFSEAQECISEVAKRPKVLPLVRGKCAHAGCVRQESEEFALPTKRPSFGKQIVQKGASNRNCLFIFIPQYGASDNFIHKTKK